MKIALVDEQVLFIESLKILLVQEGYSNVIAYTSIDHFKDDMSSVIPDIIVMEISTNDLKGDSLLELCLEHYKSYNTKIIVLSRFLNLQLMKKSIESGAAAFLTKSISFKEFTNALNMIHDGKQYIQISLRENLLSCSAVANTTNFYLTPREKEVLNMICKGNSLKQTAASLKLSVYTAQYYHRRVMHKFGVKKITDLIVFSMRHGFYIPDAKE